MQQITIDFNFTTESYYSLEWKDVGIMLNDFDGTADSTNWDKDHLDFYAGNLFSDPEYKNILGFSYPDIRWQASSDFLLCIGAPINFSRATLDSFTLEFGYRVDTIENQLIYHDSISQIEALDGRTPQLGYLSSFCFLPNENILLLSTDVNKIMSAVKNYKSGKHTLANNHCIQQIAPSLKGFQNFCFTTKKHTNPINFMGGANLTIENKKIISSGSFTGLSQSDFKNLNSVHASIIVEYTGGKTMIALNFKTISFLKLPF